MCTVKTQKHRFPFIIISTIVPKDTCIHVVFLKLINYSCSDDPISLHPLGEVHVFWYPMNIPIKTHLIS